MRIGISKSSYGNEKIQDKSSIILYFTIIQTTFIVTLHNMVIFVHQWFDLTFQFHILS